MSNKTHKGKPGPLPSMAGARVIGEPVVEGPKADKPFPHYFVPIGDMIAGWVDPPPEASDGGVLLGSGAATFRTPIVNVVSVGPDVKQIKAGDRVFIPARVEAFKVFHKGYVSVVCSEKTVVGVLDNKE